MNAYRTAALATVAGLAGLVLTACSGGIATPGSSAPAASTSVSSNPPSSPASAPSSPASTPPASNSSAPGSSSGSTGSSGSTVSVGGSAGTFPIPPGAQVVSNITSGSEIEIVLGSVTASAADTFYSSALPSAGYTITSNASGTAADGGVAAIDFTGHGYKGSLGALSSLGIDLGSLGGVAGSTIGITLNPQ